MSIESMNLNVMRYLLDTYKPDSRSPLFCDKVSLASVGLGKTEAFKILTAYYPSILSWDLSHFGDALGHAVLANNLPLAHFILKEAGCDPNKSQLAYQPTIEHAAYFGKYEMMQLLLKHGAQINGTKTLYNAMQSGSVDMLSLLISNTGGDINMKGLGNQKSLNLLLGQCCTLLFKQGIWQWYMLWLQSLKLIH